MPRAARVLSWLAACVVFLSGCALLPRLGPPPQVGPPYIPPPEPVWVVLDPALFYAADTSHAQGTTRRARRPVRPAEAGPAHAGETGLEPAWDPRLPETGSRPAPPGTDTLPLARPALSVDLPAADRRQLEDAAGRNVSAADSLARVAEARPLSPQDRAKLANALGLARQAREALARGDLRAAANLAYKARLLAAEVTR